MLIKKQVSYLPEICTAVWIAKVDYHDGQSLFNYGFKVESEVEEVVSKEKTTITLALKDMRVGDIFVIGKTTVLGSSNLAWYIIEDQTTFRAITKDSAHNEYEQAISDREDKVDQVVNLSNISTSELKYELMRRHERVNNAKLNQKAAHRVTAGNIGFEAILRNSF